MKHFSFKIFFVMILCLGLFVSTKISATSSTLDIGFDTGIPVGFNGEVYIIQKQDDGKMLIGGSFLSYKGIVSSMMIRLNPDGTNDYSFDIGKGFNGSVYDIKIQDDGKILVVGMFTEFNGSSANHIVRLNPDGSRDDSFDIGDGFDMTYQTIIRFQSDGKILIGGSFSQYKGVAAKGIIRLNPDGSRDSSFDMGMGFNWIVEDIDIQADGKLIVGGRFTTYKGAAAKGIIRLNPDGSKDSSFNFGVGFSGEVYSIDLLDDGNILVGGNFTHYKGVASKRIIRLNSIGTKDNTFVIGSGFDDSVNHISHFNNKLFIGGSFSQYNNTPSNGAVVLNFDGSKDNTINISRFHKRSVIKSLLVDEDGINVVGIFPAYDNKATKGIVVLDNNGEQNTNFDIGNGFNEVPYNFSLQNDGKVIVVGSEGLYYRGIYANKLIRLNSDGSIDDSFDIGNGFDSENEYPYTSIVQDDGKILIGGYLTSYNGETISNIIRLNEDGSRDTSFVIGDGFNGEIIDIKLLHNGKILVYGVFTSYQGEIANKLIILNEDGSRDTSFVIGDGPNDAITAIALQDDNKILLGGMFTSFNGEQVANIIRINEDGSRDTSFDAGIGFDNQIGGISIQKDGKILVGGMFTSFNGENTYQIARLNQDGSRDTSFNLLSSIGYNGVSSLVEMNSGNIVLGGGFFDNGSLMGIYSDGSKDLSFDIGSGFSSKGAEGFINKILKDQDGKLFLMGDFTNYKGGAAGYLIALHGDAQTVRLPNSSDTELITSAFVEKGYTDNYGILQGNMPISLEETDGNILSNINLLNDNISLSLNQNTQFKSSDLVSNYKGIILVPYTRSIGSVNNQTVITAFKVGSSSDNIQLSGGIAEILAPVPGQIIGDSVQIFYSNDNGVTRYPEIQTFVIDYLGEPYVKFSIDHFSDFAITIPNLTTYDGLFEINNGDTSTESLETTLNIDITPNPVHMRFSNNGFVRSERESYTNQKNWTINEQGRVYIELDVDGDYNADLETTDNIEYIAPDIIAPIGTISYDTTGTTNTPVTAYLSLNESGIITNNSGSNIYTFTQNGTFTFEFEDIAGNTGTATAVVSWINSDTNQTNSGSNNNGGSNISSNHHFSANDMTPNNLVNSIYPKEIEDAYLWATKNNIYSGMKIEDIGIEQTITRAELAKIISEYSIKTLHKKPKRSSKCFFSDIGQQSKESQIYIGASCELGLMGLESNGKPSTTFYPDVLVNKAQLGTIISRLLYGKTNNILTDQWYNKHLEVLKSNKIVNIVGNPFKNQTKADVLLLLMKSSK